MGEEVERRKKEEAGASGWEKALRVDVRKERLREWPSHSTTVMLDGETGEDEGPTASLALDACFRRVNSCSASASCVVVGRELGAWFVV